jgi:hypothetical protein
MDVTEGFTSGQDKEEFTADELDKLNSIVNAEDEEMATTTTTTTLPMLKSNNKPTTTQAQVAKNNKPVRTIAEEVTEEEMEEVNTPPAQVTDDEEEEPKTTQSTEKVQKEGFVGSQIQELSTMRLILVVIAITATCFIVNLPETGKLLRGIVGDKYCLLARLVVFAVVTYLLLLVKV